MKTRLLLALAVLLTFEGTAHAADSVFEFTFDDPRAIVDNQGSVRDILFHFEGAPSPALTGPGQEVTVSHRIKSHDDPRKDCAWTMATALKDLAAQARKLGANALVNVRSNWRHMPSSDPRTYQCAVGNWLVGVALRAEAATLFPPAVPTPSAALAPPPPLPPPPALVPAAVAPAGSPSTGLTTSLVQGQETHQVSLGDGAARITLLATPQSTRERVRFVLTLSTEGLPEAAKPHQACGVGIETRHEKRTAKARYERAASQEVFEGELSVAQLRELAIDDGGFTLCRERIRVRRASRPLLRALVDAIDAHGAAPEPAGLAL